MNIEDYNYDLSRELIAQTPAEPRDSSRLMVYDTKTDEITFDIFKNIANYLPTPSLMVFNNTKVLPARIFAKDKSGNDREILVLINEVTDEHEFMALVRGKVMAGEKFMLNGEEFDVIVQNEKVVTFKTRLGRVELEEFLIKHGTTPLPPYIKDHNMSEDELRERYQTLFSSHGRAAAAPTASLHFTNEVFERVASRGIERTFVTLDVGLGTFAQVSEENIRDKRLHKEYLEVSEDTSKRVKKAKEKSVPVIAVGTTVTRTLESSSREIALGEGAVKETDLFIQPGFDFKIVDHLITNFHVPKSSLLMLVDAFLRHKGAKRGVLELYEEAKREKMRFFSFGDAMFII